MAHEAVMQEPAAKLLFLGYESRESRERVQALRAAGYTVDWIQEVGAAILKLWEGGYHGLIVGPLMSSADRRLLMVEAPRRNPAIKRISLCASGEILEFDSDATIDVEVSVQSFMKNVNELLAK